VVRFQRTQLYAVWLVLIIILFFINWVGLKERYLTEIYSTNDVRQIAVGDLDVTRPGLEMVYMTPSTVFVIGGLTSIPWQNTTYRNPSWEINPLTALSVGDFDTAHKGDEIAVISQNATLFLIYLGQFGWETATIGVLPDAQLAWTTNNMVSGQLISISGADEIAIIGQYYNWSSTVLTGRIYVANRINSTTWQIDQIHFGSHPLLCGAISDIDRSHEGDELVTGGAYTGIFLLSFDEGNWIEEELGLWADPVRAITVGDFMVQKAGNEIALVKDQDIFIYYQELDEWRPTTIWSARIMQIEMDSVLVGDFDPFSPGHEILGVGSLSENSQPILVVLRYALTWVPSIFWYLLEPPVCVVASNFNLQRMGTEVAVANPSQTTVLSVPNIMDRTFRASQAVLLPALLLLPTTMILFALADYVGRVSEARRRRRTLEMVSRGYMKCPICKRFIPKDKAEAHRKWHRTEQFR
jgi:hypothetical protein